MTSWLMMAMVVASFLLGFGRDMAIAWRFGGGWLTDALFVCLVLPVFFENVLGVAVRDGIIAYLNDFRGRRAAPIHKEISRLQLFVWAGAALVTGLIWGGSKFWLPLLAPGWSDTQVDACQLVFRVAALLILVQTVLYFQTSVLNVRGKFLMPMWRTILLNIGAILAVYAFPSSLIAIIAGMLVGQILLLIVQQMRVSGPVHSIEQEVHCGQGRGVGVYLLPLVFAAILQQLCVVAEKYFGSLLPEGSIAFLSFAFRIATIPLTIFSLSFLAVIYPALSLQAHSPDVEKVNSLKCQAFGVCLILLVPASVLLVTHPSLVVSVLLERGAFSGDQSRLTALLLEIYAMGLPAMGIALLGGRILLTQGRGRAFLLSSVLMVLCAISLDLLLYKDFGAEGLAAAFSIASWLQAIFTLLLVFYRDPNRPVARLFARWMLAALVGYFSLRAIPVGNSMGWLAGACMISLLVHLGMIAFLGDRTWWRRDFWSMGLTTSASRGETA